MLRILSISSFPTYIPLGKIIRKGFHWNDLLFHITAVMSHAAYHLHFQCCKLEMLLYPDTDRQAWITN